MLLGESTRSEAVADIPVEDYIRLHVLAEDNTRQAQALKLAVRDAVLECSRELLKDCDNAEEAWETLGDNLSRLEAAALSRARLEGCGAPVAAQMGVFAFPDRSYGAVCVPAGEYRALRVVIGAGQGRNWWCVLFPSLCLPEGVEPGAPIVFHSAVIDWLGSLFGGAR